MIFHLDLTYTYRNPIRVFETIAEYIPNAEVVLPIKLFILLWTHPFQPFGDAYKNINALEGLTIYGVKVKAQYDDDIVRTNGDFTLEVIR